MRHWMYPWLCVTACTGGVATDAGDTDDSDLPGDTDPFIDTALRDAFDCPPASVYEGDEGWDEVATIGPTATFCVAFSEARTLAQEHQLRGLVRLVPGTWTAPADGTGAVTLPVCFLDGAKMPDPVVGDVGSVTTRRVSVGDGLRVTTTWVQPLIGFGGASDLTLRAEVVREGAPGARLAPVTVDGGVRDVFGSAGVRLMLCQGEDCATPPARAYHACDPSPFTLHRHEVTFEGGRITLDLRIGSSFASTEPARFIAARGSLDGVDFDVRDPLMLVYNPSHHHFSRDFLVWLPEPVGTTAGLIVRQVDPWGEDPPTVVERVDAGLGVLSAPAVLSEAWSTP